MDNTIQSNVPAPVSAHQSSLDSDVKFWSETYKRWRKSWLEDDIKHEEQTIVWANDYIKRCKVPKNKLIAIQIHTHALRSLERKRAELAEIISEKNN